MLSELFDRLDESIGAGADISTLRMQLSAIREQVEALETEIQQAKARIEELEASAQSQERRSESDELEDKSKEMLQLLFKGGGTLFIEEMRPVLGLSESMAEYHADILVERGLIELAGATFEGTIYMLTPKGRAYVVRNKLM